MIGAKIRHVLDFMVASYSWLPWLAGDQGGHLGMHAVIRVTIQQGLEVGAPTSVGFHGSRAIRDGIQGCRP